MAGRRLASTLLRKAGGRASGATGTPGDLARSLPGHSREETLQAVQEASQQQASSVRRGWQVKAASWVKKVHVDRGDFKVGFVDPRTKQFERLPHLLPRYFVPAGLDSFELKPYVEVEGPAQKPAAAEAKGQAPSKLQAAAK
jgi:hypothetical protein